MFWCRTFRRFVGRPPVTIALFQRKPYASNYPRKRELGGLLPPVFELVAVWVRKRVPIPALTLAFPRISHFALPNQRLTFFFSLLLSFWCSFISPAGPAKSWQTKTGVQRFPPKHLALGGGNLSLLRKKKKKKKKKKNSRGAKQQMQAAGSLKTRDPPFPSAQKRP